MDPAALATGMDAGGRKAALNWLLGRINFEQTPCPAYHSGQLKLERMRIFLARLGHPEQGMPLVHVAGTKGKGSTAAMVASMLTAAGYRTGLFSSPHLERIEERLVVDGRACSADQFVRLVARLRPVVAAMDDTENPAGTATRGSASPAPPPGLTYFEITTALAILHFADQQVDVAILEVGLGGRLDSTNVVVPKVSIITNISLDHTKQLGNTVAAIAREKAGIIKPGVSVVSGVTAAPARRVIECAARRLGCRLLEADRDFEWRYHAPVQPDFGSLWGQIDYQCHHRGLEQQHAGLKIRLPGRHQAANAAVALTTIAELNWQGWRVPEAAVRAGLAAASLPARVEVVGQQPTVIVDSAHNVASVEALVQVLGEKTFRGPRILVFAASRDKDIRGMLQVLGPHFDQIILTRYHQNPRAASIAALHDMARQVTDATCCDMECPTAVWEQLRRLARADQLIVVAGSFYIAAEMRSLILTHPLRPGALPVPDAT